MIHWCQSTPLWVCTVCCFIPNPLTMDQHWLDWLTIRVAFSWIILEWHCTSSGLSVKVFKHVTCVRYLLRHNVCTYAPTPDNVVLVTVLITAAAESEWNYLHMKRKKKWREDYDAIQNFPDKTRRSYLKCWHSFYSEGPADKGNCC